VRLLIDANLSPRVAVALGKAGLESVHVCDVGLLTAPDRSILDYAAATGTETPRSTDSADKVYRVPGVQNGQIGRDHPGKSVYLRRAARPASRTSAFPAL
jgi:uncharacterized protein DUF5615